jgi:hypothetical protein
MTIENLQFDINRLNIYLDWSTPCYGFGQLHIHSDVVAAPGKDDLVDVIICENEIMSRDFVRGVLMSLVDKIMSEGIFDDSPEYQAYHKQRCDKLKNN